MTRSLAILAVVMVNIPDFAWTGAEDHFHVRERTGYSSEPVSSARIDKIIAERYVSSILRQRAQKIRVECPVPDPRFSVC